MKEQDIEILTRKLMQDTIEQPSTSLNVRIMGLIRKEWSLAAKSRKLVYRRVSVSWIISCLAGYLLLLGVGFWFFSSPQEISYSQGEIRNCLPMLLTLFSSLAFFFMFTQLDRWLWLKQQRSSKESKLD